MLSIVVAGQEGLVRTSMAIRVLPRTEHTARVRTLYRQLLKNQLSFLISREDFFQETARIRGIFEQYRDETDPGKVKSLLKYGQQELRKQLNGFPYIFPPNFGGTKWQRNTVPSHNVINMHKPDEEMMYDGHLTAPVADDDHQFPFFHDEWRHAYQKLHAAQKSNYPSNPY